MEKQESSMKTGVLLSVDILSVDRTTCNLPSILASLVALLYVSTQKERIHC